MSSTNDFGGEHRGVTWRKVDGPFGSSATGAIRTHAVVGPGDPESANASVNDPTNVTSRVSPTSQFGEDSALAAGLAGASANGSARERLFGVMVEPIAVTGETMAGGTGTLQNTPIVQDTSRITVTDTTNSTPVDVNWGYGDSLADQATADTVAINPFDGGFDDGGDGNDYTIDYEHRDWPTAINALSGAGLIGDEDGEEGTGVVTTLSTATAVSSTLSDFLSTERPDYKAWLGVTGAEPNATGENGEPLLNPGDYTDSLDNDALFLPGPVIRPNGETILGGIGGALSGHQLTEPLIGTELAGYPNGVVQTLTDTEANDCLRAGIMPIKQVGRTPDPTLRVYDGTSTYDYTQDEDPVDPDSLLTYTRDAYRVRIVDRTILDTYTAARTGLNRRMISPVLDQVKAAITSRLDQLAGQYLIEGDSDATNAEPGESSSTTGGPVGEEVEVGESSTKENAAYFVEVERSATDEIAVALGFTPTNVAKHIVIHGGVSRNSSIAPTVNVGGETTTA